MALRINHHTALWTIFLGIAIAGCTPKMDHLTGDLELPAAPVSIAEPGSIWPGESTANMLFTDKKARYEGDIVTIIITESSQGGNNATTDTSRETSVNAGIDAFLGLDKSILARNAKLNPKIEIGGTSTNTMKGDGNTKRAGNLAARITARVVRVMGNGNLLIEGRRQITVNAEDQYIVISGIIRPDDISSINTIYSQYIADARIIYTGNGVVNDKMRPGWMTRVIDWAWPF